MTTRAIEMMLTILLGMSVLGCEPPMDDDPDDDDVSANDDDDVAAGDDDDTEDGLVHATLCNPLQYGDDEILLVGECGDASWTVHSGECETCEDIELGTHYCTFDFQIDLESGYLLEGDMTFSKAGDVIFFAYIGDDSYPTIDVLGHECDVTYDEFVDLFNSDDTAATSVIEGAFDDELIGNWL